MNLSDLKNITDIIQSLTTVFALIIGGFWSYLLFVRKRQKYPRAKIDHQVLQKSIDKKTTLVNLDIIITNISDVLLSLVSVDINVRQVLPPRAQFLRLLTETFNESIGQRVEVVDWPSLFSRSENRKKRIIEIEPGEFEQFHYTILVSSEVQTIIVESYFHNTTKRRRQLGWHLETFHDLLSCIAPIITLLKWKIIS